MRAFRQALCIALLSVFATATLAEAQSMISSGAAKAAPTKTVKIVNKGSGTYAFSPTSVTVKVGTRVVWKNDTSAAHTVTSDKSKVFNLGPFNQGKSASYVFKKAGTYMYICSIHPYMKAKVIVTK
jgi:plastocyanin